MCRSVIVGCTYTYRGTVVPFLWHVLKKPDLTIEFHEEQYKMRSAAYVSEALICGKNCFVVVKVQNENQRKVRHMYLNSTCFLHVPKELF